MTTAKVKLETGALLAAAVLFVWSDGEGRILKIQVPPGVQIESGVRVGLDGSQATYANYHHCYEGGCFADAEWSPALIAAMKKAKNLSIQVVNSTGEAVTISIPLREFAQAYDDFVIDFEARLRDASPTQCAGVGSAACFWKSPLSRER